MAIYENLTTFAGRPVIDWRPGDALPDPATTICRVRAWTEENGRSFPAYEGTAEEVLVPAIDAFAATPGAHSVEALVIGTWGQSYDNPADPVVAALVRHAPLMPSLRYLFIGDMTMEECEISWIEQADITPLTALPLISLWIRGGTKLRLSPFRSDSLQQLVIESGGLPREVVHSISNSSIPNLRHLELWLGDPGYGGDVAVADLAPILDGSLRLGRTLGLRNAVIADEVATAVADAPVLDGLEVLDLSLGALTDAGAEALLASEKVRALKRLDLYHHYLSPAAVARLMELEVQVDASDPQEAEVYGDETYRSIFVAE